MELFYRWDKALSDQTCDFILSQVNWQNEVDATVMSTDDGAYDATARRTKVVWEEPLSAVNALLSEHTRAANLVAGWDFELLFPEKTQMTKYLGADNGYYDWHSDMLQVKDVNNPVRKLSCVALLTDPSEFEGGELQLNNGQSVLNERGSIVVFPSFIEHRVTPVTAGERITAVSWMLGPAFK